MANPDVFLVSRSNATTVSTLSRAGCVQATVDESLHRSSNAQTFVSEHNKSSN